MSYVYIYIEEQEIRAYSTIKKLYITEGLYYDSKAVFKESDNIKKLPIL